MSKTQTPEARARHNRTYYENGGKAKIIAAKNRARLRNIEYVRGLKRSEPCADCGHCLPYYVMQYDHVGSNKTANVSALVQAGVSIARLDEEIAKCELVCANCHAERTHLRRLE